MLALDVCFQGLGLAEVLVAGGEVGAVELGGVDVPVTLKAAIGGEALPAARPVACIRPLEHRVAVRVLHMPLEMVLSGEGLVASCDGAGKRALLVVAAHVSLEPARAIEALCAACDGTNVVPLAARLAVGSARAIVGVVGLVGAGIVGCAIQFVVVRCNACAAVR